MYTLVHPLTRYCTVTGDNSRGVSRKDSFPNEFIWLKEWKRDCQMITEEDRFLQRGMTYKYIHIVYTASEQTRHSQRLVQKRTVYDVSSFHTWSLHTDARRQLRLMCAGMIHKFLSCCQFWRLRDFFPVLFMRVSLFTISYRTEDLVFRLDRDLNRSRVTITCRP